MRALAAILLLASSVAFAGSCLNGRDLFDAGSCKLVFDAANNKFELIYERTALAREELGYLCGEAAAQRESLIKMGAKPEAAEIAACKAIRKRVEAKP